VVIVIRMVGVVGMVRREEEIAVDDESESLENFVLETADFGDEEFFSKGGEIHGATIR
jgi:hypothetical protein